MVKLHDDQEKHGSNNSAKIPRPSSKTKQKITIGGHFYRLPHAILHKIALTLPFTSLISLHHSSKFWQTVLTDPKFSDLHLTRSLQNPPSYLFTPSHKAGKKTRPVFTLVKNSTCSKVFTYSVKNEPNKQNRFQSSGGLICVYSSQSGYFRVFNPYIKFEEVKIHDDPKFKNCRNWWWFSFSPRTKQYKIVKIGVLLENNKVVSAVGSISTLGSSSNGCCWRELRDVPHQFFGIFVECQGNLFWIRKRSLVWFDLGSEQFGSVPGPKRRKLLHKWSSEVCPSLSMGRLVNMGESIGWIQDYRLWVLQDLQELQHLQHLQNLQEFQECNWVQIHEFSDPQRYRNLRLAGPASKNTDSSRNNSDSDSDSLLWFMEESSQVFVTEIGCDDKLTGIDITTVNDEVEDTGRGITFVAAHVNSFVSPVRIMGTGNNNNNNSTKESEVEAEVMDVEQKRKWVVDTVKKLGDDATEDGTVDRIYEVLQEHKKRRRLRKRSKSK